MRGVVWETEDGGPVCRVCGNVRPWAASECGSGTADLLAQGGGLGDGFPGNLQEGGDGLSADFRTVRFVREWRIFCMTDFFGGCMTDFPELGDGFSDWGADCEQAKILRRNPPGVEGSWLMGLKEASFWVAAPLLSGPARSMAPLVMRSTFKNAMLSKWGPRGQEPPPKKLNLNTCSFQNAR